MPAVTNKIDGVTNEGFFTITTNTASPFVYTTVPKDQISFVSDSETTGTIYFASDPTHIGLIIQTSALTIDHNGDALDTSAKVATYISTWR